MYKVDNAIIMAAGVSSRFAPLSYEKPKALTVVKGEVLIERQIRQLRSAGVQEIYVIVGYKADQFLYLQDYLGVTLIKNEEYLSRNNHSSIYTARDIIKNTYICSADNYFLENPFESHVEDSYYAAVFADGETKEWCMETDSDGYITRVQVGGNNAWYMLGHAFWSECFSKKYLSYLAEEYFFEKTKDLFWEDIFVNHLDDLKMQIRKYSNNFIFEFDSIEELRKFDTTYIPDTRSMILKGIAGQLRGSEAEIQEIHPIKSNSTLVEGIRFKFRGEEYTYTYGNQLLWRGQK